MNNSPTTAWPAWKIILTIIFFITVLLGAAALIGQALHPLVYPADDPDPWADFDLYMEANIANMTWQAQHLNVNMLPAFWVEAHLRTVSRLPDGTLHYEYQGAFRWDPDDVVELTISDLTAYSLTGRFHLLQLDTWPRLPCYYHTTLNNTYWLNFTLQLARY